MEIFGISDKSSRNRSSRSYNGRYEMSGKSRIIRILLGKSVCKSLVIQIPPAKTCGVDRADDTDHIDVSALSDLEHYLNHEMGI